MEKIYYVVIADDHGIVREGLCKILNSYGNFKVIGEAKNGREAIECCERLMPDIALMDISMPEMNGLESTREIKKKHPEIKIIILTVHDAEEYKIAAFEAGANGYLLKDVGQEELIRTIEDVLIDKSYKYPEE